MARMKALVTILLCLATGTAYGEFSGKDKTPRRPTVGLAVTFTDDADSMRLPAFASRTTPLPTRFFRVGVEWKF
jgi:hypothetical protein